MDAWSFATVEGELEVPGTVVVKLMDDYPTNGRCGACSRADGIYLDIRHGASAITHYHEFAHDLNFKLWGRLDLDGCYGEDQGYTCAGHDEHEYTTLAFIEGFAFAFSWWMVGPVGPDHPVERPKEAVRTERGETAVLGTLYDLWDAHQPGDIAGDLGFPFYDTCGAEGRDDLQLPVAVLLNVLAGASVPPPEGEKYRDEISVWHFMDDLMWEQEEDFCALKRNANLNGWDFF